MIQLRTWISCFLLWLALFFNIERLIEVINLASFIYVFTPFMAIAVLFGRFFFAFIPQAVFAGIILSAFFFLKLVSGYQVAGANLPITITEIACMAVTYGFVRKISILVSEFEKIISNLTFQQIGLPPRLYDSTDTEDLYREVKRSRRFHHPLSLMIIRPEFNPDSPQSEPVLKEMLKAFSRRYVQARLAKIYSEKLRDTDLVVIKPDQLLIMLPETSKDDAVRLLDKLRKLAKNDLGINLHTGMSFFPDHSVTLNGLIEYAGSDLAHQEKGTPFIEKE